MKRGKQAQTYIIAAVFIIVLIAGFFTILNKLEKPYIELESERDLINYEVREIVKYGVNNGKTNGEIVDLIKNYTLQYTNSTSKRDYYFIFGEKKNLSFSAYQYSQPKEITVKNIAGTHIFNWEVPEKQYIYNHTSLFMSDSKIKVEIENLGYSFQLNSGVNFYFIIGQKRGGDIGIISNG